jgi:hypothetical protein
MDLAHAEALAHFRTFNYESIYLRDASRGQANAVIPMSRALVERYLLNIPSCCPTSRPEEVSGHAGLRRRLPTSARH